jgi:hypothetical protein
MERTKDLRASFNLKVHLQLLSYPLLFHFQIWGTCLGFQLLHLLPSNISRNVVLIETNSVSHASTLDWSPYATSSHMFGGIEVCLLLNSWAEP